MSPHILIVDDEPAIADTLSYALKTEGYAASWVGLGREALEALGHTEFALLIIDVGLPDMSGFEVCRQIRQRSNLPILFLTARNDEVDRIVGLEIGADDYVPKPFSPREVVSRVRAILRRTRTDALPDTCPHPRFTIDTDGARVAYCGSWLPLTRYEYRVLVTLLERPGRVYSRSRLMELVWVDAEDTLERTVDAHIKTLRAKLRAMRPDDDPIETHRGLGYSLRVDQV